MAGHAPKLCSVAELRQLYKEKLVIFLHSDAKDRSAVLRHIWLLVFLARYDKFPKIEKFRMKEGHRFDFDTDVYTKVITILQPKCFLSISLPQAQCVLYF